MTRGQQNYRENKPFWETFWNWHRCWLYTSGLCFAYLFITSVIRHLRLPSLTQITGMTIVAAIAGVLTCLVLWGYGILLTRKKG